MEKKNEPSMGGRIERLKSVKIGKYDLLGDDVARATTFALAVHMGIGG